MTIYGKNGNNGIEILPTRDINAGGANAMQRGFERPFGIAESVGAGVARRRREPSPVNPANSLRSLPSER